VAAAKHSAGLLMYRRRGDALEVFLVHPGGPLYTRKDLGVWTIPKGELEPDEDPLAVARREFWEETGRSPETCGATNEFLPLGAVRLKSGKLVKAWAFEGDWPDGEPVRSNSFTMEWPPKSGRQGSFPEVDRGEFFDLDEARRQLNPAQVEFVDRLVERLGDPSGDPTA